MSKKINLNGRMIYFLGVYLSDLLTSQGLDMDLGGVAVVVNSTIVSRSKWKKIKINAGDKIEIVHIVRGG
tara:strand:+ start:1517 stop:1726 length:210 start_codon:yes stop_codon:yes gene_type:complete